MEHRAYSLLDVKAVDPVQRIVEGFASTPTLDHGGDSMDPHGAQFKLPMPFKWMHGPNVGEIFAATVKPEGIYIKAKLSTLEESAPASLKERVDTAWHSIIAKPPLVRGLSIGWKGLEHAPIKGGGTRWLKWFWGETSAVEIPMNTDATITAVKSADANALAATGTELSDPVQSPAGVTALSPVFYGRKGAKTMAQTSYHEQITDLSNKRAAHEARMGAIQEKATNEGRTKDDAEKEEFTNLKSEIAAMDAELVDLRDLEEMNKKAAVPIVAPTSIVSSNGGNGNGNGRVATPVISVRANVAPGTAFTRWAMATAAGKGDSYNTLEYAKQWRDSTPEVEAMLKLGRDYERFTKAAVAAGTTTDATWAGPLAVVQPMVNEFLELLRPRTLIGRIPGLRRMPFNVSVPSQTAGGTYAWVGQNKPKPVTAAAFSTVTLTFAKAAGIIVLTEELVKLSTPSAEEAVRREMLDGMQQFLDVQFQDPAVAAVAGVNPASITNGAGTAAASGVTGAAAKADLAAAVATFTAAEIPLEGSVLLMSESNAFGLSISLNPLGQQLFPGMSVQGGTIMGIPVIVSNALSTRIVLVHAPSIFFADDGGATIDTSREATIQMDSAPTDVVDATTVYISTWQRNLVALKVERFITWLRARTAAVRVITAAAYNGT